MFFLHEWLQLSKLKIPDSLVLWDSLASRLTAVAFLWAQVKRPLLMIEQRLCWIHELRLLTLQCLPLISSSPLMALLWLLTCTWFLKSNISTCMRTHTDTNSLDAFAPWEPFKTCVLRLERDTVKCLHQLMLEIKEKDDESLVFVYQKPQISSVLCCLYLFLQWGAFLKLFLYICLSSAMPDAMPVQTQTCTSGNRVLVRSKQ